MSFFHTNSLSFFSNFLINRNNFGTLTGFKSENPKNDGFPTDSFKAACFHKFGDFDSVRLKDLKFEKNIENLEENEILIKMIQAPINPADINVIEGTYGELPTLPGILGNEGFGIVSKKGKNVSLEIGQKVVPLKPGFGTWRTWAVLKEEEICPVNDKLSNLQAATVAVNPSTAYRMMHDFVKLEKGDLIAQNGATTQVGRCVIQFAKKLGYKTVSFIREKKNERENNERIEELKNAGADFVFFEKDLDKNRKAILKEMKQKPKLALNCVSGQSGSNLVKILEKSGTMVTYGGLSKKPLMLGTASFIFNDVNLRGFWLSRYRKTHTKEEIKQTLDAVSELMIEDFKMWDFHVVNFSEWAKKPFFAMPNESKIILDIQS